MLRFMVQEKPIGDPIRSMGENCIIAWHLGPLNRSAPNSISRSVAISRAASTDSGRIKPLGD